MNDQICIRTLDPAAVGASRWAGEMTFDDKLFTELKRGVVHARGNLQPIKVRPVPAGLTARHEYEIVFGHRRHRACLETGFPVLAMVQEVSDADLVVQMCQAVQGQRGLSAWRRGWIYRRSVDDGLFPSARKLAEVVGADVVDVSKCLALTRLPAYVVEAFASPDDIQLRWLAGLGKAIEREPGRVMEAGSKLAASRGGLTAAKVCDTLRGRGE
jgi:ParB family chromosome partitioning protein